MKNTEIKNIPHHTRRKEHQYEDNLYGNVDELNKEPKLSGSIEMDEKNNDNCISEDVYVNVEELNKEPILTRSLGTDEAPTTKEVTTSKNPQSRLILAAMILLIIMFLVLIVITSFLLKYYLAMNKEVSHLRNHENALIKDDLNDLKNRTDDQQRMVLEDVKAFKKDLENVKQNFLQDIKAINKTLENICRTCPSGWKPIGLFCYYFSTDDLSWDNARDECIRKGAALAFLKNKEEADGLKSYIEQGRYWIGLRRDEEPQKWKWVDGSMLSYSNWHDGEPNNIHVEHCAESKSGKWNDLTCESKLKYACKKWCCC